MKVVLFDVDGTLVNVGGASKRAFDSAFLQLFGRVPNDVGVTTHGSTDRKIHAEIALATIGRDLSKQETDRLEAAYVDLLSIEVEVEESYRVMPGVTALLSRLLEIDEVALGLQTGNLMPAVDPKLKRADIRQFFSFGGYGSDSSSRTEIVRIAIERAEEFLGRRVSAGEVTVIGDSPQDIRAGYRNGVNTIGVATGVYSADRLHEEQPSCILPDLSDVGASLAAMRLM